MLTTPSDLGTDMVTLVVGRDRQKFVVHKKLLVNQSNYFKASTTWSAEAADSTITFEDDDPDAFRLLIGWVYRGDIPRAQRYITKPDFPNPRELSPYLALTTIDRDIDMSSELEEPDSELESAIVVGEHICAHIDFDLFSPEEIRFADYREKISKFGAQGGDAGPSKPRTPSRLRQQWLDRDAPATTVTDGTRDPRIVGETQVTDGNAETLYTSSLTSDMAPPDVSAPACAAA